jgi:hypothetical protein
LNFLARKLDGRVIYGEDKTPYLYRGYLWGWRPPVKCGRCEGTGHILDLPGKLQLRRDYTCLECEGKGRIESRETRTSGYLHRFFRGDLDDAPHSHPWPWSFSIVLWGGYTEERKITVDGIDYLKTRRVWPLSINWFRKGDYHRVTKLHGAETWTLFITGPKTLSWGFWVFGRGHVPWRERLAERGIHVEEEV